MNCTVMGCEEPGKWMPILLLRPAANYQDFSPILLPMFANVQCDYHREVVQPENFICDEGWAHLAGMYRVADKLELDRERTELTFEPYDGRFEE